jgi:hypothetical protein
MVMVPFFWEILRPMPLPILLNRRTRELYFEQEGELYHTSWDGIAAAAYTFGTVGPIPAACAMPLSKLCCTVTATLASKC